MADGPASSARRARPTAGMTLAKVLDAVAEYRREDGVTPIVLMGYANPIERMGHGAFATRARRPASMAFSWWTTPNAGVGRGARGSRHRPDLPPLADVVGHAHRGREPRREGLHLLRLAQGRERRLAHRHRAGGGGAAAHRAHEVHRSAWASGSRWRDGRASARFAGIVVVGRPPRPGSGARRGRGPARAAAVLAEFSAAIRAVAGKVPVA